MQMKKFQFSGENCFLMCIRNVLDGFMAWYWRNQANGGFAPCREMVSLSSHQVADPGSNWFQHTGQSLLLLYLSSSLAGDIREKSWTFKHATKIVTEPVSVTNICYLLPREWRKVCSDRTNKFKVPGPGVTSHKSGLWQAAKYKPGTTGRLLTPPPWLASDQGAGAACVCYKDQQMASRETDQTVEEWIKHSSSGWQPGGYLIFVVIYSHSSLSGWLYLPDPESPVRSQAGNTFLRLLLTEICLTSILDTFKIRIKKSRIVENLTRYSVHPFDSSPSKPNILKCPQHN